MLLSGRIKDALLINERWHPGAPGRHHLEMNDSLTNILRRAAAIQDNGERLRACLVIKARGSTPQSAGALMLVDEALNTHGTIGGGCVEAEVRRTAHRLLNDNASGVEKFKLDHDYGWDDGLICGGTLFVAIAPLPEANELRRIADDIDHRRDTSLTIHVDDERESTSYTLQLPARPRLYIAGAGHVGQALARLAGPLDFEVTLFDDREDLLKRFAPDHAKIVAGDIASNLREAPVDHNTYCVVVTRGHRHDEQALEAVVNREARYVGLIGSRRKIKLITDDLLERGVPKEALEQVHAPIGLPIGSVTVEEIAVSIAAQLIEVRRSTTHPAVSGPDPERAAVRLAP